jgi:acetyl esterase/lipase
LNSPDRKKHLYIQQSLNLQKYLAAQLIHSQVSTVNHFKNFSAISPLFRFKMDYPKQTITYKTVGTLQIKLDLYLPQNGKSGKVPVVVWFHGGGLLMGRRTLVKSHTYSVLDHGYVLVSPDYRFAPQTSTREILQDALDSLKFVQDSLQSHIEPSSGIVLDTSNVCVSGSSAGGYLALLCGVYSDIPKVLLAIYPMTNPHGDFFSKPQLKALKGHIDRAIVEPYLDKNAEAAAENEDDSPRNMMYPYMLQEAILPKLWWDVKPDDDEMIVKNAIKKKGSYKPTYVVHGDADVIVGMDQADEVVEALKEVNAEVVYERMPGLNHLFDADPKYKLEDMYAFMLKHMQ